MPVMGIESTAHTFGVGICDKGKIIANQKIMYPIKDKGMIPGKVADFHAKNVSLVIRNALKEAGLGIDDIGAIGYTKGPGLGPCLAIGQLAAKSLSNKYRIPLLPVNHAMGHIEVTKQAFKLKDPLILYVSGGNSQILGLLENPFRHYHVYGETFDIGIGNMIDSFARAAGLIPAWGSTVAKAAVGGKVHRHAVYGQGHGLHVYRAAYTRYKGPEGAFRQGCCILFAGNLFCNAVRGFGARPPAREKRGSLWSAEA